MTVPDGRRPDEEGCQHTDNATRALTTSELRSEVERAAFFFLGAPGDVGFSWHGIRSPRDAMPYDVSLPSIAVLH